MMIDQARRLLSPLLMGIAGMVLLAGCSNTNKATMKGGDPLLGDPPKMPGAPGLPTGLDKGPKGNTPASLVTHTDVPGGAKPLTIDPAWQRDYSGKPIPAKVVPVPREKTGTPTLLPTGAWTADDGDPIKRLESYGALGIRQEATPDGVRLSCFVPGGATPDSLLFLEATGTTLALAAEAIVQKIGR